MVKNIQNPAALPPRAPENRTDPPDLDSGRFDQGDRYRCWRPRGSQTWLLFSCTAGRGWFRSADGTRAVLAEPGDLWLYRPRAPQEYGAMRGERWTFDWVHFPSRPPWAALLAWPPVPGLPGLGRLHVTSAAARRRIASAFDELHRDVRVGGPWRTELALNALERILILAREGLDRPGGRALDPRVQQAVEAIAARPADRFTVASLAAAVHLSPSRFAHLFKRETGTGVIEAVLRLRLREAARLLALTSAPVKEIADQTGFSSPYHFSLMFKRRYGRSPRDYRRWGRPRAGRAGADRIGMPEASAARGTGAYRLD